MPDWSRATSWMVILIVGFNFLLTLWVLIGGWFDLIALLRNLEHEEVDLADDGRVSTTDKNRNS